MNKNIVIVHYNTPYLTECLVRSINLFVKDATIYIFDNSDKYPFVAQFDNVTVFDNTKGDIINFDKWLEQYPNREKSGGRINKWGSAKHCYSIEKCIELIGDNFILLDSDVLLKNDISELFDEKMIYVCETVFQPNSSIKRTLPFLCFINVKMCKKYGVHFFDENYMHGLCYNVNNKSADKYDTGAYFYLSASNYPHKEIKLDDYILHYKAGSWLEDAKKYQHYKQIDSNIWLNSNKKYWSNEKNKKVVYTCITDGYDTLKEPTYVTEGFDYICFTNNLDFKSNIWEIKPLPKETEGLSSVKKQRYVKINPHKILSEYELSIWVDGNIQITGDLNDFSNNTLKDNCSIYVPQHPSRKCIYEEAKAVLLLKKDKKEIVKPQIEGYKKEGFPKDYGMLQSNILLRKHNEKECINLMEDWFSEVKDKSHRDQLSFNYVLWKNKDVTIFYMAKNIDKSSFFKNSFTHAKKITPHPNRTVLNEKVSTSKTKIAHFRRNYEIRTL